MKSMKLKNMEQEVLTSAPKEIEGPKYPYGLRITLEEEQLAALGMKLLPGIDKEVAVSAKGYVCRVSSNESEYGSHRCVEIQLTELALEQPGKSSAEQLYGE